MPKTEIDYSNTIIYKITCKDPEIKDVYVGHTTNFVQRKHAHKQGCNNHKSANYDCKLYNTMRERGGWSNWKMEIINFFNCRDHYEARQKEQEYFISLNANLNSIEPMPKPKEPVIKPIKVKQLFICELCNVNCHTIKGLETHNETNKHKKQSMKIVENETDITPIEICEENSVSPIINVNDVCILNDNNQKYNCVGCHYKCYKKSEWNKHISTNKHKVLINPNDLYTSKNVHKCNCGNIYKHSSTLCAHKKNCNYEINNDIKKSECETNESNMMLQLIKQNEDFKTLIIEQNNKITELYENIKNIANQIKS
jgi:hypothetical protein